MALILSGDTGPSFVQSAAQPTGSVLQVIETVKTNSFSSSSTSFTAITGFSATITPKFSTSKILVFVSFTDSSSTSSAFHSFNLLRGSTPLMQPATTQSFSCTRTNYILNADNVVSVAFQFTDSPATTSATTYSMQMKVNGGTGYIGNRSQNDAEICSVITLLEIAG
jgi:hypothetical protein